MGATEWLEVLGCLIELCRMAVQFFLCIKHPDVGLLLLIIKILVLF